MTESLLVSILLGVLSASCSLALALFLNLATADLKSGAKRFAEILISLPQVLPPTVLGFGILYLASPMHGAGLWLFENFGIRLVFTFPLLVAATIFMSMPMCYSSIRRGLAMVPKSIREGAELLGFSRLGYQLRILLPLIKGHCFSALALGFGQALGAFGVVFMVGGNIPGRTRTASIYIYEQIQLLNWAEAGRASLVLLLLSVCILVLVKYFEGAEQNAEN